MWILLGDRCDLSGQRFDALVDRTGLAGLQGVLSKRGIGIDS